MNILKSQADYNMIDWWKHALIKNYANFEGRARRSEFWYFQLMNMICLIGFYFVFAFVAFLAMNPPLIILMMLLLLVFAVGIFIPHLAVSVRRLHDTGKSGFWILLAFIPFGSIVLLVFYCLEGDAFANEYGPNPKSPETNQIDQIGRDFSR